MDEKGHIFKGARIEKSVANDEVMAKINSFTLSELTADDVFTFKVAMCGNAIDRDYEAFTDNALKQMGELFVGKTIIKDHRPTADNQIGRIYATEVVSDSNKEAHDGGEYKQLVAHCYMLKTDSNSDLIAEVSGGIKKEVSVGFRVSSAICSVCGTDNTKSSCAHWWGKEYESETCYFKLDSVSDAYELSFVAVPAQSEAGTVKSYNLNDVKSENDPEQVKQEEPEEPETEDDPIEDDGSVEKRMRLNDAYIFVKSKKED